MAKLVKLFLCNILKQKSVKTCDIDGLKDENYSSY